MGVGMAYFTGDTPDVPNEIGKELIFLKYAVPFDPVKEKKQPVIDLPAGFPGRTKLINAGFPNLESLKGINDFTDINGIGKTLASNIKKALY